jgi:Bax protein
MKGAEMTHMRSSQKLHNYTSRLMIGISALMIIGLYVLATLNNAGARKWIILQPTVQKERSLKIEKPENNTQDERLLKEPNKPTIKDGVRLISVRTAAELSDLFKRKNYNLDLDDDGHVIIPRLYLAKLPKDFNTNIHNEDRQELFLQSLLPLVLDANHEITRERKQLLKIKKSLDDGQKLTGEQQRWIKHIAQKYKATSQDVRMLLKRVDTIPPSLALAQAIVETGWGTSHAARNKNSAFGTTLSTGVKAYENLYACVRSYVLNLNSNPAYADMRKIRHDMRQKGVGLCSEQLLKGLSRYCELRQKYIKRVLHIIRYYELKRFDTAQLQNL